MCTSSGGSTSYSGPQYSSAYRTIPKENAAPTTAPSAADQAVAAGQGSAADQATATTSGKGRTPTGNDVADPVSGGQTVSRGPNSLNITRKRQRGKATGTASGVGGGTGLNIPT